MRCDEVDDPFIYQEELRCGFSRFLVLVAVWNFVACLDHQLTGVQGKEPTLVLYCFWWNNEEGSAWISNDTAAEDASFFHIIASTCTLKNI
jgi:hypothetical protein